MENAASRICLNMLRFLPILLFMSCHNSVGPLKKQPVTIPQPAIAARALNTGNYEATKAHIATFRKSLAATNGNDAAFLQTKFVQTVVDSLLPFWYGTPWDYNGVTQQPGRGAIACGYFITTVLQDAGLTLNRVKLAQCPSAQMIKTLVAPAFITHFSNKPLPEFLAAIQKQGFGLYIAGLDFHTGFLYHDGAQTWFMHAKWANPAAVVKEDAATSSILASSRCRITGKLSADPAILKHWANR